MAEQQSEQWVGIRPSEPASLTTFLAIRRTLDPAIIYGASTISYAQVDDLSRRAAAGLDALGVGPGDRVGVWLPNIPAWLVLYFACIRLGAIAVAVNTRFRSVEVTDIVGRSGCKVLALWAGFKGIDFAAILRDVDQDALTKLESVIVYDEGEGANNSLSVLPKRRMLAYGDLLAHPPLSTDAATPDSPCNIFTTSGTTKAPKFVLHKQSVIVRHAEAVARHFEMTTPEVRVLQATPLCGVFGFCQAMAALAACRPMVLMPLFDAEEAVRLMQAHTITHTSGSDDMIDRMLAATAAARPFPSLRFYPFAAFNPALSDIVERTDARGVRLCGLYGMGEVQALFAMQPADAPAKIRARGAGIPVSPTAEVRVRDPEDGRVLPHGEVGEIEIKGPSVMVGYFGDEEATHAAFTEDGFFRTGDLGYTEADGGFVYLSRMGDVLRLGGFLVNPGEIEARLLAHPAVEGCQVVGVTLARAPGAVAFVTLPPGTPFDEAALRDWCREGLAGFKVPARIVAVDEFPVTMSANGIKIQRNKLRDMAQALVSQVSER